MKGVEGEIGEMKIPLRPDARELIQILYILNLVYKKKVKVEIDRMLESGIIDPLEESEWISAMVVQEKKTGGIRICVDLRKLNDACMHDPFPTPFTYEFLENVGGQEVYSFTYRFSVYCQIIIALEGQVQNHICNRVAVHINSIWFKECTNNILQNSSSFIQGFYTEFLEVYLDDWTIFSLLKDHVEIMRLMLQICRQCHIYLNIKKCIFSTSFGILLGHIV
jgi:hypothetical protein